MIVPASAVSKQKPKRPQPPQFENGPAYGVIAKADPDLKGVMGGAYNRQSVQADADSSRSSSKTSQVQQSGTNSPIVASSSDNSTSLQYPDSFQHRANPAQNGEVTQSISNTISKPHVSMESISDCFVRTNSPSKDPGSCSQSQCSDLGSSDDLKTKKHSANSFSKMRNSFKIKQQSSSQDPGSCSQSQCSDLGSSDDLKTKKHSANSFSKMRNSFKKKRKCSTRVTEPDASLALTGTSTFQSK